MKTANTDSAEQAAALHKERYAGSTPKSFLILFWGITALYASLMLLTRIYPFVDVPNHLAVATIYRYYNEPGNQFAQYFTIHSSMRPNTFHPVFCSLSIFPTVEFANRVFYGLYALLLPWSAWLAIRRMGGNQWYSLLSLTLLFNYNVVWGFVGFTFGLPVVMLLFCAIVDYMERPRILPALAVAVLIPLLFFIHALAGLFGLFFFLTCCAWFHLRKPGSLARDALLLAPVAMVLASWWLSGEIHKQGAMSEELLSYYTGPFFKTLPDRLRLLTSSNSHLLAENKGRAVAVVFSLAFLIPIVSAVFRSIRLRSMPLRDTRLTCLYVLLAYSAACYFLLPDVLLDNWCLYQRFWPMLALSLLLLGSVCHYGKVSRLAVIGLCLVCLAHFGLHVDYFRDFQRQNAGFTRDFLPAGSAQRGDRLAGLIYDYKFRGRPVYLHFPSYYITWFQGIATTQIVDCAFPVVWRATDVSELPASVEWVGKVPDIYYGQFGHMEQILVRGSVPEAHREYMGNFRRVRTTGAWSLWKNVAR